MTLLTLRLLMTLPTLQLLMTLPTLQLLKTLMLLLLLMLRNRLPMRRQAWTMMRTRAQVLPLSPTEAQLSRSPLLAMPTPEFLRPLPVPPLPAPPTPTGSVECGRPAQTLRQQHPPRRGARTSHGGAPGDGRVMVPRRTSARPQSRAARRRAACPTRRAAKRRGGGAPAPPWSRPRSWSPRSRSPASGPFPPRRRRRPARAGRLRRHRQRVPRCSRSASFCCSCCSYYWCCCCCWSGCSRCLCGARQQGRPDSSRRRHRRHRHRHRHCQHRHRQYRRRRRVSGPGLRSVRYDWTGVISRTACVAVGASVTPPRHARVPPYWKEKKKKKTPKKKKKKKKKKMATVQMMGRKGSPAQSQRITDIHSQKSGWHFFFFSPASIFEERKKKKVVERSAQMSTTVAIRFLTTTGADLKAEFDESSTIGACKQWAFENWPEGTLGANEGGLVFTRLLPSVKK
jgi:hypothetical protein